MKEPSRYGPKLLSHEEAEKEILDLGYRPAEPYPGRSTDNWLIICLKCDGPWRCSLNGMRTGRRCPHRNKVATEKLLKLGFKALVAYPGRQSLPWLAACVECGLEQEVRMTSLRLGMAPCPRCKEKKDAEEAKKELEAAGYRPLVRYPGAARDPWPSVCCECGQERRPSLDTIRSGKRCKHDTGW